MGYRFSTKGLITEIEVKQTCSKHVLNLLLENVIIKQIHSNTFGGGGGGKSGGPYKQMYFFVYRQMGL